MKRHRIVIAGCGNMARTWAEYALARQDAEIVGLADKFPASAEAFAQKFGLTCPTFTDVGEALRATGATLMFDVAVPDSRRDVVTAALAAGCDVMAEKPLGATMEQARDIVAAADRSGRFCAIMQNRRYDKRIRALRDVIASGRAGEIGFACADFFLGPHFGGFREAMDSPLLLDMAIHTFDQARFMLGKDPIAVTAHEWNPPGSWYNGNASAVCLFEYADGTVFSYRGSWCAEGAPTSWESSWRLVGSRGTVLWDGHGAPTYEVAIADAEPAFLRRTERFTAELDWEGREGHAGCLDEMFAALQEGRRAETDCRDNIRSLAMVHGALRSAKEGRKVAIEF
ncbi:oxidoreductase [Gordoniibacillus kamchatkensis]|uniref:Oxidoreductase n=1 Tax=Gordoniibacillus kamchatkensis TaxID=1590651 RepID=A0ABR5AES2_9BACL|nr:Gfo/Idh/MocA family oxidoreductase [Paenibacillus sp. VKM B-2647]KIL39534.1 oxidoreductase [Paenibacillus sp. VKM B-2647]